MAFPLPDLCNTERFRSRCAFDHYLGQSVKRQQAKKLRGKDLLTEN